MQRIRYFFTQIGKLIQGHPVAVLLLALLLIGVAGAGAAQIESVTGNRAFVGNNPTLETFDESFDRGSIAMLVRGEVSDPATMRAIDRYDRRATEIDDVVVVNSPADQVRAEYGRIPNSQAQIETVVGSPDTVVVTAVTKPGLTQQQSRPIYLSAVDAKEWARFPSGISATVTGSAAFSAQLSVLIQQSTQQLLGMAVGLMTVALFLLFRGVRLRLLPIVSVFVGVIYTFGAIGFAGVPNSTLTSAVFPILIGLGIDYSVQFHERYEEELEQHPPLEALPAALGGIGPPVFIAALSAMLGFGATWLSARGTPAFVWFAQTSIFGIALTFSAGLIILLPLLTLYVRWRDPSKSSKEDAQESDPGRFGQILGRSTRLVASRPLLVLLLAIVLFGAGMSTSSSLDTMTDSEEFIPDDLPAFIDLQQFRSATEGGSSVQYDVLITGDQLRHPATLRWMEQYRTVAKDKPLITGVRTPATLIKQHNAGEIPETRSGVTAVLSDVPADERRRYYTNGNAHIIIIGEQNMNTEETLDVFTILNSAEELTRPPAGIEVAPTGQAAVATPSIVSQIENRNTTTAIGILFVFSALLIYYRSLLRAVAPLIPMIFVIGWQNLYMSALSIPVSPLGASLGAMSVGIGAEYTIIVSERYFEEVTNDGISRLDAIETAGVRVGKAITVSGMTTVFGFSALTLSPFPILGDFGYLTVGVIFLTLVSALVTLPPTLIVLGRVNDRIQQIRAGPALSP